MPRWEPEPDRLDRAISGLLDDRVLAAASHEAVSVSPLYLSHSSASSRLPNSFHGETSHISWLRLDES